MHSILQKSQVAFSAATLAMLLVVGSPAVAFARGGEPEAVSTTATRTTTSENSTVSETTHTEAGATTSSSTSDDSAMSQTKSGGRHQEVSAKAHSVVKTDAERQKTCEERKTGLDTKFASITRNSQAYQSRIDDVYTKVLAYQVSSKLNPMGFADLTAAANAARATAHKSVTALAAAAPAVDCTSKSVAGNVADFKKLAATARTDLKAYKMAVKAVVKSLRDSQPKATTTTTTNTDTKSTEGTR